VCGQNVELLNANPGGYWKTKEEALDRTVWRIRFGRDCGPVIRQTTE